MTESKRRVGVVGVAGAWSSESLVDEVARRTGERLLIEMEDVAFDSDTGRVLFGDLDLCSLDGVIVKKIGQTYSPHMLDRLELLRYVQESGVRMFSNPASVLRLIDRLSCTITLQSGEIPMPRTVVTESVDRAAEAIASFGAAVLKPLYSTKARGMKVVAAGDDCKAEIEQFRADGNPVLYVQEKLAMPDRDLGVAFLGGEYLGTYARVSGGDSWNTTIRAGGRYERHEPSEATLAVARRAQALFDLDFTCVDVVETARGPLVFEVSAFGGFRGMRDGLGIDMASTYADYVFTHLEHKRVTTDDRVAT